MYSWINPALESLGSIKRRNVFERLLVVADTTPKILARNKTAPLPPAPPLPDSDQKNAE
jgi:hypothetical protein